MDNCNRHTDVAVELIEGADSALFFVLNNNKKWKGVLKFMENVYEIILQVNDGDRVVLLEVDRKNAVYRTREDGAGTSNQDNYFSDAHYATMDVAERYGKCLGRVAAMADLSVERFWEQEDGFEPTVISDMRSC